MPGHARTMTGNSNRLSPVPIDRSSFFRHWLVWATLGEGLGFAVVALTGVTVALTAVPPVLAAVVLLTAGAVEGALLGAGQVHALGALPISRSSLRAWIPLTSLAAVAAWCIGLLPSLLPRLDWSSPAVWVMAGLLGLVLLATIPTAQLVVLRRLVRRPWRWLPANMLGWAVGLGWTMAVSPLVDSGTAVPMIVALYATAGGLMALTVAAATGICWLSWLRHDDLMSEAVEP